MRSALDLLAAFYEAFERKAVSVVQWLNLDFYEVALCVGVAVFCYVIYRLDRSAAATEFRFEDFFTHGDRVGKADIFKLFSLGAFMVHSLIIWRQEVFGHLQGSTLEWYAGIWSGVYVTLKGFQTWKPGSPQAPGSSPGTTATDSKAGSGGGA